MSRGYGRIERAIRGIFRPYVEQVFSSDDLVRLVFPDAPEVTKALRASVMRAAHKIAAERRWSTLRRTHGNGIDAGKYNFIFFNRRKVMSYARALHRSNRSGWYGVWDDWNDQDWAPDGRYHHLVAENGKMWEEVEQFKREDAAGPLTPEQQAERERKEEERFRKEMREINIKYHRDMAAYHKKRADEAEPRED
jgi:hypothetical protein